MGRFMIVRVRGDVAVLGVRGRTQTLLAQEAWPVPLPPRDTEKYVCGTWLPLGHRVLSPLPPYLSVPFLLHLFYSEHVSPGT